MRFPKPGPPRRFRPASPKLPNAGLTKASVLNQRSGDGSSSDALPTTFGLSFAAESEIGTAGVAVIVFGQERHGERSAALERDDS